MTMLVNDVAVLLSLPEVAAGGQPLKKSWWGGAGGGRSASPRNAFHVSCRCLCAFASVAVG